MRKLLLAGATGVIGKRLVPLLIDRGYAVVGTTRFAERADRLRAAQVEPLIVDVFDAQALARAVLSVRPDAVIHQLTDLPRGLDADRMAQAICRNARVRDVGTRNLVDAANAAGVRRIVAQSIGWMYAPASAPHVEGDPLDLAATGDRAVSLRGVVALETQVLDSPPIEGLVLRYGHLYGPETGTDAAPDPALHVDAAAFAALLAIDHGSGGVFNIAEPGAYASSEKARRDLGWNAAFRFN